MKDKDIEKLARQLVKRINADAVQEYRALASYQEQINNAINQAFGYKVSVDAVEAIRLLGEALDGLIAAEVEIDQCDKKIVALKEELAEARKQIASFGGNENRGPWIDPEELKRRLVEETIEGLIWVADWTPVEQRKYVEGLIDRLNEWRWGND